MTAQRPRTLLCAPSVVDTYLGATSAGTTNASSSGEKPNAAPYAATAGAGVRVRAGGAASQTNAPSVVADAAAKRRSASDLSRKRSRARPHCVRALTARPG
jgi:hypothetical protein